MLRPSGCTFLFRWLRVRTSRVDSALRAACAGSSRLPPPLRERLVRVATCLLFFLPQLDELAALPAPPAFGCPLAHHVFVLAGFQHLTGNLSPQDDVVAQA